MIRFEAWKATAFEAWNKWRRVRPEWREEWRDDLRKIRTTGNLHGIERPVGVGLFVLNTGTPTRLIQLFFYGNRDTPPKSLPEWYVGGATIGLVLLYLLAEFLPSWFRNWFFVLIASYLLASIIVYLLNVVLLDHKVFGGPRSPERSLILFILNVTQVVLIFAIFYRWWLPDLEFGGAFVDALLVFGTVAVPFALKARPIAAFQVAIDFMLLAVFLAHFVGGLGRDEAKDPPTPGAKP
jgi:hypothetical protein